MKPTLAILLFLPQLSFAEFLPRIAFTNSLWTPPSYLLKQDFEGTGYDNSETWTEVSGKPWVDADNTQFAINGSQNLILRYTNGAPGEVSAFWNVGGTTNVGEVYVFTAFKTVLSNANNIVFQMRSNLTDEGFVRINASGNVEIFSRSGSGTAATSDTIFTNTTYYFLAHWNNPSGTGDVEFSTTATFTGSGNKRAAYTGATDTGYKMNKLVLQAVVAGSTNYFDYVRVDDVAIQNSPY